MIIQDKMLLRGTFDRLVLDMALSGRASKFSGTGEDQNACPFCLEGCEHGPVIGGNISESAMILSHSETSCGVELSVSLQSCSEPIARTLIRFGLASLIWDCTLSFH